MSNVIRWLAGLFAAGAALLVVTPAALAQVTAAHFYPPEGGSTDVSHPPAPPSHLAVAGGTPGWQIVLIALGSAVAAAALTLLIDRAIRHKTAPQPAAGH
jgi:hypothetical protein